MPARKIAALTGALAPGQRLLGLDLGQKTIGLAISDPGFTVASPLQTIRRGRLLGDVERLRRIAADRAVGALVIGLPLNMDGSEGRRAQATRDLASLLADHLGLPVAFWDERLSTAAVERAMIGADLSRRRRRAKLDRSAAAYILQGALDAAGGQASIETGPG